MLRFVDELASALWGFALLASFVGWGRWIAAGLRLRERAHLGLELAWGFAATLAAGGWLCEFGLAKRPVLAVLVGLGGAGLLLRTRRRPTRAPQTRWQRIALAVVCVGLLGLGFAIALLDRSYQVPDDHAAYLFHARKLIETGSLHEPFSFRRLGSYGGQSFLHALLLVVAPLELLNLVDKGICRLAFAFVVLAHLRARPRCSLLAALVATYGAAAYPDFALNTSSIFSGVLAFAGLWMTLELCRRQPGRPIANGILTGLAIGATVPLRQNYALACALLVDLEHACRFAAGRDRRQVKELLAAGLAAALSTGGWAQLQLHSSGTPLFPLLPGFANPDWSVFSARSLAEFASALEHDLRWRLLSLQLAICALALARVDRSAQPWGLAPLAGSALIAFGGTAWLLAHVDPPAIARTRSRSCSPSCCSDRRARQKGWLGSGTPPGWGLARVGLRRLPARAALAASAPLLLSACSTRVEVRDRLDRASAERSHPGSLLRASPERHAGGREAARPAR